MYSQTPLYKINNSKKAFANEESYIKNILKMNIPIDDKKAILFFSLINNLSFQNKQIKIMYDLLGDEKIYSNLFENKTYTNKVYQASIKKDDTLILVYTLAFLIDLGMSVESSRRL